MAKISIKQFLCFILFIFLVGVSAFSQTNYVLTIKILSTGNNSDTYGKIYVRPLGIYVYRSSQLTIPANTTLALDGEDNAIFYMTQAGECAYRYSFQYWEGAWPSYYLYNTVSISMDSDKTVVAYYEETGPVCQTPTPLPSITTSPYTPTPENTPVPTPEPTPIIIPTQDPGIECTCDNACDSALVISIPFEKNGKGMACFIASTPVSYINSWNLKTLEVNGINFINRWVSASNLPAPVNDKYYIYYNSYYPWGHFEIK